ncbi:hypothetical protein E3V33_00130 [Candidatus Marinimicrobia bacterium MT.SAG.4]|nr:hypothetical protein E3V33_00130 [Candidatus Marinimicrobia bacterium MT.SAG.4]
MKLHYSANKINLSNVFPIIESYSLNINQERVRMKNNHFNFEGLWFEIYKKILKLNEELGDIGLDKGQLREVATTIFIAQSNKGIVRPYNFSRFQREVLKLTAPAKDKALQQAIIESISDLTGNGKTTELYSGQK